MLLDDFAWTNSGFDGEGNAEALAAILSRELRGGVFGFDEYRHGHGRANRLPFTCCGCPGQLLFV